MKDPHESANIFGRKAIVWLPACVLRPSPASLRQMMLVMSELVRGIRMNVYLFCAVSVVAAAAAAAAAVAVGDCCGNVGVDTGSTCLAESSARRP